jgi:hypothetical protein
MTIELPATATDARIVLVPINESHTTVDLQRIANELEDFLWKNVPTGVYRAMQKKMKERKIP